MDVSVSWATSDWIATRSSSVTPFFLTPHWCWTAVSLGNKLLICIKLLHSLVVNTPGLLRLSLLLFPYLTGQGLLYVHFSTLRYTFQAEIFYYLFCYLYRLIVSATGLFSWYSNSAFTLGGWWCWLTIGITCPPTIHFKFITKCTCVKCYYKEWQLILLESATVGY